MGRGRAKAKQTKVARDLKYSSPNTDLTALQRELAGAPSEPRVPEPAGRDDDYDDDRWASSNR
ncbi:MAG: DUF3073 domain-containing protein [Geodermatophilaceae bacterium]|jgi:hypothetical protein|nr:DUF3073 domain-containing protein [Geodermatophilaceae bacterium]